MIEIFTSLFDVFSRYMETIRPNCFVSAEYQSIPASFPAITIEEKDNYVNTRTIDSGSVENHAITMLEINVYSNAITGKRTEAWSIMNDVDSFLNQYGWIRTACVPVPNYEDNTIYRLVARYRGVVDSQENIWRN